MGRSVKFAMLVVSGACRCGRESYAMSWLRCMWLVGRVGVAERAVHCAMLAVHVDGGACRCGGESCGGVGCGRGSESAKHSMTV